MRVSCLTITERRDAWHEADEALWCMVQRVMPGSDAFSRVLTSALYIHSHHHLLTHTAAGCHHLAMLIYASWWHHLTVMLSCYSRDQCHRPCPQSSSCKWALSGMTT